MFEVPIFFLKFLAKNSIYHLMASPIFLHLSLHRGERRSFFRIDKGEQKVSGPQTGLGRLLLHGWPGPDAGSLSQIEGLYGLCSERVWLIHLGDGR